MSTLLRLAVIARLVARPLPLEGSPLGKHIKKGGKGKVGGGTDDNTPYLVKI